MALRVFIVPKVVKAIKVIRVIKAPKLFCSDRSRHLEYLP